LDNPGRTWQPVRWAMHPSDPYWILSFENVTGRRFRLTDTRRQPNQVFSEFRLGN
jgi:hypothetical protein